MNRTIKAIERHLTLKSQGQIVQRCQGKLVAEWQQRGPEMISGQVFHKLRLAFTPPRSAITASAAG